MNGPQVGDPDGWVGGKMGVGFNHSVAGRVSGWVGLVVVLIWFNLDGMGIAFSLKCRRHLGSKGHRLVGGWVFDSFAL